MMIYDKLKQLLCWCIALIFLWLGFFPGIERAIAHAEIATSPASVSAIFNLEPSFVDWNEADKHIRDAIESARQDAELAAQEYLEEWKDQLIQKVDDSFLDWYLGYVNQKAMEFGIPFALITLELDSALKLFRYEDEMDLSASEIIQKRMIEDFNKKFEELVLNESARNALGESVNRVFSQYGSAVGQSLENVREIYQISDDDWRQHLGAISELVYELGSSKSSLTSEAMLSDLTTELITTSAILAGGKLVSKIATKSVAKLSTKAGASIAAKAIAQLTDPALAIGFLVWDVVDYKKSTDKSRQELHDGIAAYLEELEQNILENGIFTALEESEFRLCKALEPQSA